MLANLWAVPSQPCSQYGKRRCRLRSTLSTITRLPSGSPASRSGAFRDGVLGLRSRYCPWLHGRVGGTSAHPHSANACRVRRSLAHPGAYADAWLGSEYLPQALRHASAPVFAIPPSAKALAPWLMSLVRPRYSSGIPFYLLRRKPQSLRLHNGAIIVFKTRIAQIGWADKTSCAMRT